MKVHEYQGKAILAEYGVPVPQGRVIDQADEGLRLNLYCEQFRASFNHELDMSSQQARIVKATNAPTNQRS